MFSRHGFDAVTVEDICAEAGIAPATFYRYFGSKESVVFFYEEEFLAAAREIGESVEPQQATLDQFRHIVRRCMLFFEEQSAMLTLRDEIVLPHPALLQRTLAIQRKFENSLAGALAARRPESPIAEASLDAAVCLLVLRLGLRAWRSDAGSDLAEHTSAIFESLRARLR
jgi:AcrR family transcriptional regulator